MMAEQAAESRAPQWRHRHSEWRYADLTKNDVQTKPYDSQGLRKALLL